ncbi:MarR family winged helix-turn-helix transcriptional regulator [Hydrocarboniphaga sp.]|uniref:MarR family winged helix-turn-helix transcriptional regulator n=1 Tax=Hydrocarboniphaga sp. TaxID=2033016 RepID=UPI003D0E6860
MSPAPTTVAELIPAEFRGHLGFLVAKAKQLLSEELDALLREGGYSIRHFAVLSVIRRNAGLRQTDLSDMLGIDRTTMMKMADELEQRGLLQRIRSAEDRRAYALELTAAGQAWYTDALVPIIAEEERFLAPLSPGERALLQEMLMRLVENALDRRQVSKQTNNQCT